MPTEDMTIAYCHACGGPMDVTEVAPFSNVECPQCGKHTRVKREFGPYTLLRRHAIGGMSVVFVAHDNTLDREVALKILNEDYSADERRITAFEEEARTTASISHPHVVRLLTTGRAFDRFFIAMELVTGGHFEAQIRERGTVPEIDALPLALQVAEGLQAAHAAGLIHRDMKPGNILLDAAGNAKIVDFGLALVTKGGTATATEIWATPYYVPPETIEGLPEDFRSDIYAFGATLYHALSGVPSCAEETMDTLKLREAKQNIRPLSQAAPSLTPETCAVVDRAMAYQPEDRFSSYDEMIAALRYALQRAQAGPRDAAQDSATVRRRKAAKQRERFFLIGAGALVLLAGGFATHLLTRKNPKAGHALVTTPDSMEAIPQTDPGSVKDPAVAARIGQRYKVAREAVEKSDFEQAAKEFAALRDDPEVQEPTGTWAGVEAVIAAYLDGRASDARAEAILSAKHASAAKLSEEITSQIVPALEKLSSIPAIDASDLDPSKANAAVVMSWMLAGLKDWEQGSHREAAAFFKAIDATSLKDSDAWARHYQKVAKDYLAERKRLADAELKALPDTKAECQQRIEELNGVLGTLVTKGRARFNVREWQLALNRRIHELDNPKAAPVTTSANSLVSIRPQIDQLVKDCQFNDAAWKLKALEPQPKEVDARNALVTVVESAGNLLTDLESDLGHGEIALDLKLRDGSASFTKVAAASAGHLKVTSATGESREIGWKDLSPDSIVEMHRTLIAGVRSELEKLRRHESAIAFDWLVGDRARATAAADRLASQSIVFKSRWETITAALK